jgi:hypothetical protein
MTNQQPVALTPTQGRIEQALDSPVPAPVPLQRDSPPMVTRPLIASIASMTRPSWPSVVGSTHWLQHAKTTIISGMGGDFLCGDSDWGIQILHDLEPPYLIAGFGEGIDIAVISGRVARSQVQQLGQNDGH